MLRAQKGLARRLYLSVYNAAGSPAAPVSAPTVTVTGSDGTIHVNAQASTALTAETGVYTYDLSPANATATIDNLTVLWAYTIDSKAQTATDTVMVVSSRLCSPQVIDDSLNRGGTSSNYTARKIQIALSYAEDAFERVTAPWFATRYATATVDGNGLETDLVLPKAPVIRVRSATVAGTAISSTDLAALVVYEDAGIVAAARAGVWATGRKNVTIGYEYGYADPPGDVARAVALIATSILSDGPWDDRGFGVSTDGGFVRLLTAGVSGAAFSIPEVQATVKNYSRVPGLQ